MAIPIETTQSDAVLFSDALGVLSSCGGRWMLVAQRASSLDKEGKFNIDTTDDAIKGGALATTDPNSYNWFGKNCKRIRFSGNVMSSFPYVPRGTRRSSQAYMAAAVIAHELYHWNNGPSESPAWQEEREFWQDLLHMISSRNNQDARIKDILEMARGREDEGYTSGYYNGPRFFGRAK